MNATPVLANATVVGDDKARTSRARSGNKRSRNDEDEDDDSEGEEEEARPVVKRNGSAMKSSQVYDIEMIDPDGVGRDGEVDSKVYCTCRQVSYGEMIGCDDDDCEIEWVSLLLEKRCEC